MKALTLVLAALALTAHASVLTTIARTTSDVTICDPNLPGCASILGSETINGTSGAISEQILQQFVPGSVFGVNGSVYALAVASASSNLVVASTQLSISRGANSFPVLDSQETGFATAFAYASSYDFVMITGGVGQGTLVWNIQNNCFSPASFCSGDTLLPTTFTFGQPFKIGAQVGVQTSLQPIFLQEMGHGRISFSLVDVKGADGRSVEGYQYFTGVPEPATWMLMGIGIAGLLACSAIRARRT